jgi:hypothetical protein
MYRSRSFCGDGFSAGFSLVRFAVFFMAYQFE